MCYFNILKRKHDIVVSVNNEIVDVIENVILICVLELTILVVFLIQDCTVQYSTTRSITPLAILLSAVIGHTGKEDMTYHTPVSVLCVLQSP